MNNSSCHHQIVATAATMISSPPPPPPSTKPESSIILTQQGGRRRRRRIRQRAGRMTRKQRFWVSSFLGVILMVARGQNPEVNIRTIECANSMPPLVGYDRIEDVVNDQFEEYQRIEQGMAPRPPYVFRLCPNTEFTMGQSPLTVLLSDSLFACGPNIASSDSCVFKGGFEQIIFEPLAIMGYEVERTNFVGITFDGFTGSSINGYGTSATTATFTDCVWQNFNANNILDLGVEAGMTTPGAQMRVEIENSAIENGMGGTYFSNDGGRLVFDNVRFDNIQAISAVASSNGAVTMLDRVIVNNADVDTVGFASGGASQIIVNTTVTGLIGANDIFATQGEGSTINMINTYMVENKLEGASAFTGVRLLMGATGTVTRSTFAGNTGVSFGFLSRGGSMLDMVDVELRGNSGIAGALTAATYADDSATLRHMHTRFIDNTVFTAQVFGLAGATVEMNMMCIESGQGDTVLFMSDDSTYTDVSNYVNPDVQSTSCQDSRDGRLVQENDGAGCFDASDSAPCSIGCARFATATECSATMAPTLSPSAYPTTSQAPTTSPAPTIAGPQPPLPPDGGNGNGGSNGGNNGSGNGGDNGLGNGDGNGLGNGAGNGDGNPATAGFPPAFAPALNNPAISPFFTNPAFRPSFTSPAFAPAFFPSFITPTCDPALLNPANNPAFNNPAFNPAFNPAYNPAFNPAFNPAYRPSIYGDGGKGGKKGKKGTKSKSKSKGKGGKGHKSAYSDQGYQNHQQFYPRQDYHNPEDQHQYPNPRPDPNQQQNGWHDPMQQQQQSGGWHHNHHHPVPQNNGWQDPNQQSNGWQHPMQQQQQSNGWQGQGHDPHSPVDPHEHGETLYLQSSNQARVEWGTDHGWNQHTAYDETFQVVRPQTPATSNRQGYHPRNLKGNRRFRHLRERKGIRQELKKRMPRRLQRTEELQADTKEARAGMEDDDNNEVDKEGSVEDDDDGTDDTSEIENSEDDSDVRKSASESADVDHGSAEAGYLKGATAEDEGNGIGDGVDVGFEKGKREEATPEGKLRAEEFVLEESGLVANDKEEAAKLEEAIETAQD
ncbi:expressed unknown protein [Seminavis robusta]|uniref:Right handed beta helix domain-containing protein n=1 Tax=Seminavis robusta TaxID=568900 RepID=A0A9N8HQ17_9STRA|nr:expressed unknown protein [Seminavis robusta]|eukprot:Sro945_g223110.1 n/a (1059) ;mRNA; f:12728-16291